MDTPSVHGAVGWHHARRRSILADHRDVTSLGGHNPWTALFIVGLVLAQLAIGVLLRDARWYIVAIAAYGVGSVIAHALGVLIHECAHNLVMGNSDADKALGILANVPLVLPGAIDFRHKHLLHHRHLGEGELRDFQMPVARGAAWVGGSPLRKVVWLSIGALLFPRGHVEGTPVAKDGWEIANLVAEIVVLAPYTVVFGPGALAYLVLSGLLAFGPHPLGVRGFGEHLTAREGQPTSSYYGPLNAVSFNVGYHVEHHDFPAVPWNRLPRLNRLARAYYAPLATVDSWIRLFLRYIFVPRVRLDAYADNAHGR
jgi:sphingolipid delta-4 desaturase